MFFPALLSLDNDLGVGLGVYVCPLARPPEFVAGIVIPLEMRDGWRCPKWLMFASVAGLGAEVLVGSGHFSTYIIPIVVVIPGVATLDLDGLRSPLRTPLVVVLGSTSYCLYMVHVPIYTIARLVSHDHWTIPGKVFGVGAVVIGALFLAVRRLRFLVERPAERALPLHCSGIRTNFERCRYLVAWGTGPLFVTRPSQPLVT